MRVLVTGAAGRIGRAVLALLAERGIPAHALTLEDPGGLPAERVIRGDAGDVKAARAAVAGVDAVIHLAAIPVPTLNPPEEVFGNNTLATFTVLEQAGAAGVRRVCLASSYAITGLPFAAGWLRPAYLPVDDDLPSQAEDPYALSKQVDELTARMMARRHGMGVIALRLPFVGGRDGRLRAFAAECAEDPGLAASSMWAYLETRDAARACLAALDAVRPGEVHAVHLAAPLTLVPYPTEPLLRRYYPGVEVRRPLPGRAVPIDTSRGDRLLGFRPEYRLPLVDRELPE
ncbi:nucleoside-diphosphate-sugar epimerase [Thermocatellispora tengchongensis]|uniref:Nucleoside-diphosphate-sugar epimerase n=1 Tax=Thermocatellispora tengchongensis TaxID=1073253 RepID=A0A840NZH1_9ACTN|nr:NAD(P)-dependent oxidoreductase [Thermocatellispora tengchongensis]MBB5131606.1 nucleoside-diphosphate-sugar epimerase [Thermocatellispora tengchongensis]